MQAARAFQTAPAGGVAASLPSFRKAVHLPTASAVFTSGKRVLVRDPTHVHVCGHGWSHCVSWRGAPRAHPGHRWALPCDHNERYVSRMSSARPVQCACLYDPPGVMPCVCACVYARRWCDRRCSDEAAERRWFHGLRCEVCSCVHASGRSLGCPWVCVMTTWWGGACVCTFDPMAQCMGSVGSDVHSPEPHQAASPSGTAALQLAR